ncbi:MAG: hypothetical protein CME71_02910 [Halobacteriovorax sp.]|nr:hypothetical protein [Halobacteriovorax sp.]
MRTYLIDNEQNEIIIDLTKTVLHGREMVEFDFSSLEDGQRTRQQNVKVRKLAGDYFVSFDGLCWKRVARQELPKRIVAVDRVYDVYRGYKPSGLATGAAGDLVTQMPGKVVQIGIKPGDKVTQGQTLLILEAMKMENEIKTSVDGTVKAVHVKVGDALEPGVLMIELDV